MENITYTEVRNPKWLNQAHTFLKCEVNFDHIEEEWVEFSCVPDGYDVHEHTGKIFAECVEGAYGTVSEFDEPLVLDSETTLLSIRNLRNELLTDEVDPIVTNPLRWESMTPEEQKSWSDYRQALLDLPSTSNATLEWNDTSLGYDWVNLDLPTKP